MNSVQIIYLICSVGFLIHFIHTGSTLTQEDYFSYSRLIFLTSVLIQMSYYELLPYGLSRPPVYPVYKVVAAVLVANMLLLSVWTSLEGLVKLIVSGLQALPYESVNMSKPKWIEVLPPYIMVAISIYYLILVAYS